MIELPPIGNVLVLAVERGPREFVSRIAHEARERILQARIAEAEEQRGQWAGLCVRLEARIAELEADAERYRWLRDEAPAGIGEMASVRSTHGPQEIDAAIDAARGKE